MPGPGQRARRGPRVPRNLAPLTAGPRSGTMDGEAAPRRDGGAHPSRGYSSFAPARVIKPANKVVTLPSAGSEHRRASAEQKGPGSKPSCGRARLRHGRQAARHVTAGGGGRPPRAPTPPATGRRGEDAPPVRLWFGRQHGTGWPALGPHVDHKGPGNPASAGSDVADTSRSPNHVSDAQRSRQREPRKRHVLRAP